MTALQRDMNIPDGAEWEPFAGLEPPERELRDFLEAAPFNQRMPEPERPVAAHIAVPDRIERPPGDRTSTQEAFGRVLADVARSHPALADRIVTTSPDVTVSTNLGSWVNRRGIFGSRQQRDVFKAQQIVSALKWEISPKGQHIELGIAENNLFILLAALGPVGFLFRGTADPDRNCLRPVHQSRPRLAQLRLLPGRPLHSGRYALGHLAGPRRRRTPVGVPAARRPGPAGADDVRAGVRRRAGGNHALELRTPAIADGGAVYLRLSTRVLPQPARELSDADRAAVIDGAYWLVEPCRRRASRTRLVRAGAAGGGGGASADE